MVRPTRIASVCAVAAFAVLSVSCPNTHEIPGHLLATFLFTATPTDGGLASCVNAGYAELPDGGFEFTAQFSGEPDGSVRWMTLGDFTRDATFDDQVVSSPHSAPRTFSLCTGPDGGVLDSTVVEGFTVALLSNSQNSALSLKPEECPADPLDAGSIPFNPDGGVMRPGMSPTGSFDAVKACGVLEDSIQPDPAANCAACTMTFTVTGIRQ